MVFYAACLFSGYLIQRYVSGKKSYLLAPIGAFLSSIIAIMVGAFIIAPLLKSEVDGKQAVLTAVLQTFWGTFLVAFGIWFYRRRKEKAPEEPKKNDQVY
jgi:hypothetical protein